MCCLDTTGLGVGGLGGKPADIIFKNEFRVCLVLDSLRIPDNLLFLGTNALNMS